MEARWTSSAKMGVGTALNNKSRVWFTLSHGILNEVYFARMDQTCTRDMGMVVSDGGNFFFEEKADTKSKVHRLADGVPAFRLINTCREGRYRIDKQIVTEPVRDAVLRKIGFSVQQGALAEYQVHVLLAPHLGNHGGGNTAWTGEFEGTPIRSLPVGKLLRVERLAPATVHWSADDWKTAHDVSSREIAGPGVHIADLPTADLAEGGHVTFTFDWPDAGHWEGTNFVVRVGSKQQNDSASVMRRETNVG